MAPALMETVVQPDVATLRPRVEAAIEGILARLPDQERLTASERHGILARYAAVLEGNFIYWMTGAYLSVESEGAKAKIEENLLEEVRDSHPAMLRRFSLAAKAVPTDPDAAAVCEDLTNVRLFIGRMSATPILLTMAFFEGFIQRFMPYLADLARCEGSTEMEYTDVHGVCDITHTNDLYRALGDEMAINPPAAEADLFEGVNLLDKLLGTIVKG